MFIRGENGNLFALDLVAAVYAVDGELTENETAIRRPDAYVDHWHTCKGIK